MDAVGEVSVAAVENLPEHRDRPGGGIGRYSSAGEPIRELVERDRLIAYRPSDGPGEFGGDVGERQQPWAGHLIDLADVAVLGQRRGRDFGDVASVDERFGNLAGREREPAAADEVGQEALPLLAAETAKDDPGQQAVLDRLFDLLLIAAVRAWFARPEANAPVWYRAHVDPVVGRALRTLHTDPSHPWTVAKLARAAGVSRALFARRFTELVGEPPMTYLTGWRLALAADLLHEPGATVEAVARRVGYSNGFALSTAFKRVRGISPAQHRLKATTSGSS